MQLLGLGLSDHAIEHRVAKGRLHPIHRGVYAVGRPDLSPHGNWMGAVLACGSAALLSHESAAALWGIRPPGGDLEVSVIASAALRRPGIVIHRRMTLEPTLHHRIPVTDPASTLVDLAARLTRQELEAAVSEADKLDLVNPQSLREAVASMHRRPGLAALRRTLDVRTFALTDSDLERRFLPIARRAGLPAPLTRQHVNGFKVDFFWPDLGLVVETDGLRYHRTPAQQAADRRRDQAHTAAGLAALRFTHGQIRFEPGYVEEILTTAARRRRPRPVPA